VQSLDDLRRVIRRTGVRPVPRAAARALEDTVGGSVHETAAGSLLVVRREYPLVHAHGRQPLALGFEAPLSLLAVLSRAEVPARDPGRLLFLDTETTGLAGGTGTYAFLVGAGWREDDRFVVVQYFMRDLDEEPALLAALAPLLEAAGVVVTFNGAGFDLPLLETRFILGHRHWPGFLPHLDLLRPARRVFAPSLADCRLATLEREVLGHLRANDVPGALIPSLYFDFLRTRRSSPLAQVFEHNRHDVLSLVALLGWLGQALERHEVLRAPEQIGLGRLWELVDPERACVCYRAGLAAGLSGTLAQWARLRLATWEKRSARWDAACALWEEASRHTAFDPRPWEELAKFYEHRQRDFARARLIVERALALARTTETAARTVEALTRRLERLGRRTDRGMRAPRI